MVKQIDFTYDSTAISGYGIIGKELVERDPDLDPAATTSEQLISNLETKVDLVSTKLYQSIFDLRAKVEILDNSVVKNSEVVLETNIREKLINSKESLPIPTNILTLTGSEINLATWTQNVTAGISINADGIFAGYTTGDIVSSLLINAEGITLSQSTSFSGARHVFNATGYNIFNSSDTNTAQINVDGSGFFGANSEINWNSAGTTISLGTNVTVSNNAAALTGLSITANTDFLRLGKFVSGTTTTDGVWIERSGGDFVGLGRFQDSANGADEQGLIITRDSVARVLLTEDGLQMFDDDANKIFDFVTSGANEGDVFIGDQASNYIQWDNDLGALVINLDHTSTSHGLLVGNAPTNTGVVINAQGVRGYKDGNIRFMFNLSDDEQDGDFEVGNIGTKTGIQWDESESSFRIRGKLDISDAVVLTASGALDINSGGTADISSGGSIDVQSGGAVDVKSGGDVGVESGGQVGVQSGGLVDISDGGDITLAVGADLTLTESATDPSEIRLANSGVTKYTKFYKDFVSGFEITYIDPFGYDGADQPFFSLGRWATGVGWNGVNIVLGRNGDDGLSYPTSPQFNVIMLDTTNVIESFYQMDNTAFYWTASALIGSDDKVERNLLRPSLGKDASGRGWGGLTLSPSTANLGGWVKLEYNWALDRLDFFIGTELAGHLDKGTGFVND